MQHQRQTTHVDIGRPSASLSTQLSGLPDKKLFIVEQIIVTPPPRPGADTAEAMKILRDIAVGDAPGNGCSRGHREDGQV